MNRVIWDDARRGFLVAGAMAEGALRTTDSEWLGLSMLLLNLAESASGDSAKLAMVLRGFTGYKATMSFDQGELDFQNDGSEAGYRNWLRQLEEKKRAFEVRHGIMIGRRVRVQLTGETHPLEGMIYLVPQKHTQPAGRLRLSMGNREFTPLEIESIIRLEDA